MSLRRSRSLYHQQVSALESQEMLVSPVDTLLTAFNTEQCRGSLYTLN